MFPRPQLRFARPALTLAMTSLLCVSPSLMAVMPSPIDDWATATALDADAKSTMNDNNSADESVDTAVAAEQAAVSEQPAGEQLAPAHIPDIADSSAASTAPAISTSPAAIADVNVSTAVTESAANAVAPASLSITQQRYHYELAKKALARNDQSSFNKHYAQLGDYPLVPYLDYGRLRQSVYDFDFAAIDTFFAANAGNFLEYRLREQLLHALATRNQWDKFDEYYRQEMADKALQCHHLLSRLKAGDASAMVETEHVWVEGKSHPKSCDPLFNYWRRKGGLKDDLAWQRFHNAMQARKTGLARYVTRYMSAETKKYAEEYLGVHGYPSRITDHRRFAEQSEKMQQIIAHGISRFARFNPKQALYHWELYEAAQLFSKELATDTKVNLVKQLTFKGETEAAENLIRNSQDLRQADAVERLIREALRQEQYAKVLQWIDRLDEDAQNSDRWLYWRARAQDELGLVNTTRNSRDIYLQLANGRSFYGFLSADIIGHAYTLDNKPSEVSDATYERVKNSAALVRIRELGLTGNTHEAHAEWHFTLSRLSQEEIAAAGRIAREWGWYNKGIHAMIRGNYWDDLDVRFPLAYRETVEQVSSKVDIDTALVFAIARQESAFSETARSSAGAMGLMQLMPGTAKQTAKRSGMAHADSKLFDPEYNITLGSTYLNELLQQFNGNRILAAAAYNAGPHRVTAWLKKNGAVPFDVWIESIPFQETRGYVQNVLAFSVIYSHKLGVQSALVTEKESNHAQWR